MSNTLNTKSISPEIFSFLAWQKLSAYIAAAVLTQYIGEAEQIFRSLETKDWASFSISIAKCILAGIIVWRAFVDQSLSQQNLDSSSSKNQIEAKDKTVLLTG